MTDENFRAAQFRDRYADHVRPVNELVDHLRDPYGRGWVPYVAPWHGGVKARVLSLLRDPGPMTQEIGGSGFLCTENDDPSAERSSLVLTYAGIDPGDVTPWNAYPWYVNRPPKAAELQVGLEPLVQLLDLMPLLQVVLLQGGHAHASWRRLTRQRPQAIAHRRLAVFETYHPSRQALWHADPAVRDARTLHRDRAFHDAAQALSHRAVQ